jgi:hypothetical protein
MPDVMPQTSRPQDLDALPESRKRVRERVLAAAVSDMERGRSSGVIRKNIAKLLARADGFDLPTRDDDSEPQEPGPPDEEKRYRFLISFFEVEQTCNAWTCWNTISVDTRSPAPLSEKWII